MVQEFNGCSYGSRVSKVNVDEGDDVKADDMLAELSRHQLKPCRRSAGSRTPPTRSSDACTS
nr:biotin/lipoyl-binding protein [Neisseria iguanae]